MNDYEMECKLKENERLVHYILGKYYPAVQHDEDVIQSGMIGLWIALTKFDESKGYQFSTYATRIIRSQIGLYFRRYNRQHRIPTSSIYEPVASSKQHGDDKLTVMDLVADTFTVEDQVLSNTVFVEAIEKLVCNERDRNILKLYYKGFSQTQIAEIVKLSQSQVCRVLLNLKHQLTQEDTNNVNKKRNK